MMSIYANQKIVSYNNIAILAYFVVSLTASGQPANVDVVTLDLLRVDEKEDLLSLLKVAIDSFSLSKVIVERIHIEEIALL